MKKNLESRQTHSVHFRKKSLQRLLEGYEKMREIFDESLKRDLGLNPFMANFLAHGITKSEIQDLYDNLDDWTRPKTVKTPVGI
jgi:hypothetical protein